MSEPRDGVVLYAALLVDGKQSIPREIARFSKEQIALGEAMAADPLATAIAHPLAWGATHPAFFEREET